MDPIDPANQFPDPSAPVYRHSIFRLGPTGLAVALVAIVFPIIAVLFYVGRPYPIVPVLAAAMWAIFIAFLLLGPVIHYYRPSPFEQGRQLVGAYGGTANFKMGNYPARVLIYMDGLEIRAMYSAYFIPFEKMDEPQKGSFFMPGVLIISNLPEVPNRVRFFSFSNNQEIIEKITNLRMSHSGAGQGSTNYQETGESP